MNRWTGTLVLIFISCLILSGISQAAIISPSLQQKLNNASPEETFRAFLWFAQQEDIASLTSSFDASGATLAERHNVVVSALQRKASENQGTIINLLEDGKVKGEVISYNTFWIANMILMEAKPDFIRSLAKRPELSEVFEDFKVELIDPIKDADLISGGGNLSPMGVEDGLTAIGAPQMWAAGYTGAGRIVMNIDTGVDGNHTALSSRWIGNNGFPASQGWLDTTNPASSFPSDGDSHGTHTMGTITGLGQSTGDTIGVAFGALWMAAKAIVTGGNVAMAFQWAADPDGNPNTIHDVPDVISNSWGATDLGCFETYWLIIDNLEAIGPVVVFSAGNSGPGRETVSSPATRSTTPTNAFAVGAVNGHIQTYPIASFSGRGPSSCDGVSIKPEVVAPGVNVRSSVPGGGYASNNWSGTSMSCPHVAGAVALLRQYNPNATADEIKTALMESAHDLGTAGQDNDYGWGIINVYDAMLILEGVSTPHIRQWDAHYTDGGNNIPEAGETGDIVVTLWNTGTSINNVYAVAVTADQFGTLNSDSSFYGNFASDDTLNNSNHPYNISFDANTPRGHKVAIDLQVAGSGGYSGVVHLYFRVGIPEAQAVVSHDVGNCKFTMSNFGHYGLGTGAMLAFPGGIGFKYPVTGPSNLFEAGLLIGTSSNQIVDCVRDENQAINYDFYPTSPITAQQPGDFSDQDVRTSFNDQGAFNPINLNIQQNSYQWADDTYDDFVVVEYIINNFGASSANLVVANFNDWDFPWGSATSDKVGFDREHRLGYMYQNPSTNYRGIAIISEQGVTSFRALENDIEVYPPKFTDAEKWQYMTEGFIDTLTSSPKDASFMISTGPITVAAGATDTVVIAYVGGTSLAEIGTHAAAAYQKYWEQFSSVDEGVEGGLPRVLALSQNYPNPFNARTILKYALPSNTLTRLEIFNLIGQKVATLVDRNETAGIHTVEWNADDHSSGLYFYKLTTGDKTITKRMTLLK